jgi:hypothetical protein
VRVYESFKRRQDDPFPQTNVGRACLYDERPAIVTVVSKGEYGERVTFEVDGSTTSTTPGLDPRFRWP